MSWTNLKLGGLWQGSWPEHVDVISPDGEEHIIYVPERTCRIEKMGDEWRCSCCGETVGCDDPWCELFVNGNGVELWAYCLNCGAKVERGDE